MLVHKVRNVMNALPKSAQPGAKRALQEIYNAEDRDHAEKAIKDFERAYGAKWPKAAKKVTDEADELLAFYDFPAEHWVHLRTTNPIESTFSTVELRTKVTRGAGSPAAALTMVFKLVESAQARLRAITAPHLVALVRAGARFELGRLVERPEPTQREPRLDDRKASCSQDPAYVPDNAQVPTTGHDMGRSSSTDKGWTVWGLTTATKSSCLPRTSPGRWSSSPSWRRQPVE